MASMNIVILWTGVTAPMAACWRALAAVPGVRVTVLSELHRHAQTAYDERALLEGLDHDLRYSDEPLDVSSLVDRIAACRPDVMIVLGWRSEMCRAAVEHPRLAAVPKVLAFDMVFALTPRKLLAPLVLRRHLRRFVGAFVPGERAVAYARWLGFREDRIERGLMGVDHASLKAIAASRCQEGGPPRRFLYAGRYVADKGIRTLVEGYRRYRQRVADPWPLTCCGMGPEKEMLRSVEGIEDRGFVQPDDLPKVFADHAAFVLASTYDPWPFVLLEAVSAGLPVVCTTACGSHGELVKPGVTGQVIPPRNPAALTEALVWLHAQHAQLCLMGSTGSSLAAPYAKEAWAERVVDMCRRVTSRGVSPQG